MQGTTVRRRGKSGANGFVEKRDELVPQPAASETWMPAAWDNRDAAAWKALLKGTCQPHQQKQVLEHLKFICGGGDAPSHDPNSTHNSAHAEGRRWIWRQVEKILRINLNFDGGEHG